MFFPIQFPRTESGTSPVHLLISSQITELDQDLFLALLHLTIFLLRYTLAHCMSLLLCSSPWVLIEEVPWLEPTTN